MMIFSVTSYYIIAIWIIMELVHTDGEDNI